MKNDWESFIHFRNIYWVCAMFRHDIYVPGSEGQIQRWTRKTKSYLRAVSKTDSIQINNTSHSTQSSIEWVLSHYLVFISFIFSLKGVHFNDKLFCTTHTNNLWSSYFQCVNGMTCSVIPWKSYRNLVNISLLSDPQVWNVKRRWFVIKLILYVRFCVLPNLTFHLVQVSPWLKAEVINWLLVYFAWFMMFSYVFEFN